MVSRRISLVLGALVLFAVSSAFGAVKGTLTANGKTFKMNYAYATTKKLSSDKNKTDVFVIFTDQDLPAGALFDDFVLMTLDEKSVSGFTITIDPDKRIISDTLFSPAFKKMKQFSTVGKQKLDLTTWTKDRVAGTVSLPADDFFDETFQYNATFDVPVQAKPAEKPVVL